MLPTYALRSHLKGLDCPVEAIAGAFVHRRLEMSKAWYFLKVANGVTVLINVR